MNAADIRPFVIAAARSQGLRLDPAEIERVCEVFLRNAGLARLVVDGSPEAAEPAPTRTQQRFREKNT